MDYFSFYWANLNSHRESECGHGFLVVDGVVDLANPHLVLLDELAAFSFHKTLLLKTILTRYCPGIQLVALSGSETVLHLTRPC